MIDAEFEQKHHFVKSKGCPHTFAKTDAKINKKYNFKSNFDESEVDTLGGIVMRAFGRVPKKGEITSIDQFKFKILQADGRRIRLLRVTPKRI